MVTGQDLQNYANLDRLARNSDRIAAALERIADAFAPRDPEPAQDGPEKKDAE